MKKKLNAIKEPIQFEDKLLEREIKNKIKKDSYGNLLKVNTEKKINYNQIQKHLRSLQILRLK